MENINEHLEENCFVFIQGNEVDIEMFYDLVRLSKDDKVILYPEAGGSFVSQVTYRPYIKTVVTENPWVISSYSRKNVWVIRNGKWVNPSRQTYGCSVGIISGDILGVRTSIPLSIFGGLDSINRFKEKIRLNKFDEGY